VILKFLNQTNEMAGKSKLWIIN